MLFSRGVGLFVAGVTFSGCVFGAIDHEGQPPPCVAGFVEVAGRCVRGGDAAVDVGAVDAWVDPTVDAWAPDGGDAASCTPACNGDVITDCSGRSGVSACEGDTSFFCEGGTLRSAHCARSCSATSGRCVLAPLHPIDAAASTLDATLGSFVVPAGHTYVLDASTGEVTDGATVVRDAGPGIAEGIAFQMVTIDGIASGVLAAERVQIAGTLDVRGSAALVLVAQLSLELTGTIDASADADVPGPGGGAGASGRFTGTACAASTLLAGGAGGGTSGNAMGTQASGGAGGSLASMGGAAGAGGCAAAIGAGPVSASGFVGGGGGGAGGDPSECNGSLTNAPGGGGGGIVYLLSPGLVRIAGTIDASGGGGGGGGDCGGGGGGGSGGYVVVDATEVDLTGGHTIAANGGGGGGGGGRECIALDACSPTPPGALPGEDGVVGRRALGDVSTDANGGDGSNALGVAESGVAGTYNGGGGGGGAGRVLVHAHVATGSLSASPSTGSGLSELRVD